MSQDPPTEAFDPRAADAPTVAFNQPAPQRPGGPPPQGPSHGRAGGTPNRSRTLIIVLSIIGGLLLVAVAVVLTLLITGKLGTSQPAPLPSTSASGTPSASPSQEPSASPSPSPSKSPNTSPSASPPPAQASPTFVTFSPANNTSVGCTSDSAVTVTFTWTSAGASEAAIGVGTTNAFAQPYQAGLPPSGTFDLDYQCTVASQIYTVSIKGSGGQTNRTITLTK